MIMVRSIDCYNRRTLHDSEHVFIPWCKESDGICECYDKDWYERNELGKVLKPCPARLSEWDRDVQVY